MKRFPLTVAMWWAAAALVAGAPAVTLTNLNHVYFLVDSDPTAIATNVVRLSGNLTNWQKFATNVLIGINPTPGYLPYNNAGVFADSPMFKPSATNFLLGVNGLYGTNLAQLTFNGGLWFGSNTVNILGVPTASQLITSVRDNDNGDPAQTVIQFTELFPGLGASSESILNLGSSFAFWNVASSLGANTSAATFTVVPTNADLALANGSLTFYTTSDSNRVTATSGTLYVNGVPLLSSLYPFYVVASTNIGFDGQFYWGPGTTNVMYRSGTDLVYTNSVTTGTGTSVRILSGDGTEAKITAGGNVMVLKGTAAVELQDGLLTGNELRWWVNRLVPMQTNAVLGNGGAIGSRFEFANVHAFTNTIHGFYDTTSTNYSRLAISHTGTNGAVVFDSQSAGTAGAARPFVFRIGVTTNSFRISETNWVDSMVPALGIVVGATAPTLGTFGTGGALKTYMFQDARDDEANFTVQLNHTYKQGTDIQPHVHWAGVATPTTPANTNVVWELTYSWQNVGDAYSTDTTITVTNSFTGTAWKHQLSDLPAISGSGKTVSSIIIGRIRRVANSATADNYDKSCAFLGFDVHHQVDSPGSDTPGSKSF